MNNIFKFLVAFFLLMFERVFSDENSMYFINSDESTYTENKVVCKGNVIVVYFGKILSSDEFSYDKKSDTLHASGNVIIKDEDQNVYFFDELYVKSNFKSGKGKNVKIIISDKSRLSSKKCVIRNGKFTLSDVIYTPCYKCIAFDQVTWQIKSKNVIFDPNDTVEYSDATLEFLGNAALYLPYLSHASSSVKRKSGFLCPEFYISNNSGINVIPKYFISISETQELLLKPVITQRIGSAAWAYYGTRFTNGEFNIDASITGTKSVSGSEYANQKDVEKIKKSGYRGHIFSKARYEIDEIWRCGFDVNLVSDRYYLMKFPMIKSQSINPVWESNLLLEGFDGRNYTSAKTAFFQCYPRYSVPKALPIIERNYSTNLFSGTFDVDAIFLNMAFNDSRSVQKFSSNVSWSKKFMMPYGNIIDFKSLILFRTINVNEKKRSLYASNTHAVPQVNISWQWPLLLRNMGNSIILTPIVGFIAASNRKYYDVLEDQYWEINHLNFHSGSRAMSPYNIDYGKRIYYGSKISFHNSMRNICQITIGRSKDFTTVPKRLEASGGKRKNSNIVASSDFFIADELTWTTNGSFSSKRNQWTRVESGIKFAQKKFDAEIFLCKGKNYYYNPFASNIDVNEVSEDQTTQKFRGISLNCGWQATSTVKLKTEIIYGLDKKTNRSGLIKHRMGVEFKNECISVEMFFEKINYNCGDVKNDERLQLIVHLKNIN